MKNINSWIYHDSSLDDIPENYIGFVYIITNLVLDKSYIGKKLFHFQKTTTKVVILKSGIKKKKKLKVQIESDWRDYYSSSEQLKRDVLEYGKENFKREILYLAKTKGELSYKEGEYQFRREVLLDNSKWYNGIINLRVNSAHIRILKQK